MQSTETKYDDLVCTRLQFKSEFERCAPYPIVIDCVNSNAGGEQRWAVRQWGHCLSKDGEWIHEPSPSNHDENFYARCRFNTLDEALAVVIPLVQQGGNDLNKSVD